MRLAWLLRPVLLKLSLGGSALIAGGVPDTTTAGVVVEGVTKGGAAEAAGIQSGDLLLSWSQDPIGGRKAARGVFVSPFALTEAEIEEGPRGITLYGRRRASPLRWQVRPGGWGLKTSPILSDDLRRLLERGEELASANRPEETVDCWRIAAGEAAKRSESLLAAWFLSKVAAASTRAKAWTEVDSAFRGALALVGASNLQFLLLRDWARTFLEREDHDQAQACLRQALDLLRERQGGELLTAAVASDLADLAARKHDLASADNYHWQALTIRQSEVPDSAAVAATLFSLGVIARQRGAFEQAEAHYRRSLVLYERLTPGGLESAAVLANLGVLLSSRGRLAESADCHRRALAIRERSAPDSLDVAASLHNLGLVTMEGGDLETADGILRRALTLRESLSPGSPVVATSLQGLGILMWHRLNLAKAESYWRDALALVESVPSESLRAAALLNNLGALASKRGDSQAAEMQLRRSLEITQRLRPGTPEVGNTLANLGLVAKEGGDLGRAENYYQRALAVHQKLAPESLDVSRHLLNLGNAALACGDAERSRALLLQAHSLTRTLAPSGLDLMEVLGSLGDTLQVLGDLELAEAYAGEALAIAQRLIPGTAAEATILHTLGLVARKKGEDLTARDLLCDSVGALESQRSTWGGSEETKLSFRTQHAEFYQACIETRIAAGEPSPAFDVLERSRTRALLEMMAERDIVLEHELPEELRQQRKKVHAAHDKAGARLLKLNPVSEGAEIARLQDEMSAYRRTAQEIVARIRQTSPRLASLRYPEALTLASARKVLDPGTVLLSYAVGKTRTYLFVVEPAGAPARPPNGLTVVEIPVGEDVLRTRIASFRRVIQNRTADRWPTEARHLYDLLIRPVEPLIAAHARVLISPDGALSLCPFAALLRSPGKSGRPQFLVEWKPLHVVAAASLYAEILRLRARVASRAPTLVAFGDPRYPAVGPARSQDPELGTAASRGAVFSPLPSSRREVEDIARLFPDRSRLYLRDAATEENAKAIGKSAAYVHFSCHGFLDERVPLNSALVLTIPDATGEARDNGLLQAWEILESVRLEADLVTLSACETALGKEVAGEGLIGLTRAFLYAGARSVLASLWRVPDESTALLMRSFYAKLASGSPKDEALRAAQITLIRQGAKGPWGRSSPLSSAHPLQWAAFQLVGDWK